MAVIAGSNIFCRIGGVHIVHVGAAIRDGKILHPQFLAALPPAVQQHHHIGAGSRIDHCFTLIVPCGPSTITQSPSAIPRVFGRIRMDVQERIGFHFAQVGHIAQPCRVISSRSVIVGKQERILRQ